MGWTSYNATHYKNGKVDRKAEILDLFKNDNRFRVLKIAAKGSVIYTATEVTYEDGSTRVFGEVFLTSTDMKEYHNFYYKDMSEDMGPCQYDCPASILELLSPTDSEYALEWRKKCWETLAQKKAERQDESNLNNLPVGTVIEMPYWGKNIPTVKLTKQHRFGRQRPIWIGTVGHVDYRFTPKTIKQQGYTVIQPETH